MRLGRVRPLIAVGRDRISAAREVVAVTRGNSSVCAYAYGLFKRQPPHVSRHFRLPWAPGHAEGRHPLPEQEVPPSVRTLINRDRGPEVDQKSMSPPGMPP